ncbi:MAG TPA: VWA domain-containing protein [Thermoanaerobaculia bacterium]|jgi:VWFA-related protein|nr:VWA domain-containing protein [Thermoanaerobaculia bacterium]
MVLSRTRSVLVVVCLMVCLLVCNTVQAAPPSTAQSPFGEVIEVNVVNVDVHVTDRDGRPVPGLKSEDFEVYEDGKRVKVTNFEAIKVETETAAVPKASAAPAPAAPEPAKAEVAPEDRLHLVVYVDNLNLDPAHRTRVLEQVRTFVKDLRPEDRVMLVTNDLGLKVRLPFTADPAALEATLDAVERLPAAGASAESDRREAMRQVLEIREAVRKIEGPCSRSIMVPAESYAETMRNQVLQSLKSMTVLVNSLSGVPGRKALLYVSDGLPATPGEEVFQLLAEICSGGNANGIQDVHDPDLEGPIDQFKGSEALMKAMRFSVVEDLNRLAAHANANRVTLYTLQAAGLQSSSSSMADYGPNERVLQLPNLQFVQKTNLENSLTLLASETGGKAILNANDVSPDLRRMKEDLSSYYSLGYVPEHTGDAKEHRIEVKIRKPGLQVRSRRSYRDKPAIERVVDRTLAAVYHGFEDNPLEVTLKLGEQVAQGDRFQVPIKLRIPLFKLAILPQQDKIYRGSLRLLVSTRDEQGGVSPIRQIQVPLEIPEQQILYAMGQFYEYDLILVLPPGEQHVAITVRDEATAATSILSRTLTVGGEPAR